MDNIQQQQLNAQIASSLKNANDVKCEKCEGLYFAPAFVIKHLSALVSPVGKEMNIPLQLFRCTDCGHVNSDFLE